ncbi:MAG: hypothetical protein WCR58_10885 [Bacteroidales bacterium]|jgi:N-acetylglucosamine kinase-like BadF-type ATPase|nr:hypothetical protein [Bacteroidales bacterium]MDD3702435.1 hypothetical protein [Bacteroidales bacterium]
MKLLLGESGATKIDWILIDGRTIVSRFVSNGFNPFHGDIHIFYDILHQTVFPELDDFAPERIIFYSAGCSTSEHCQLISQAFQHVFGDVLMEVKTDIEGAARALLGQETGIACVLGTGSNVCLYDGNTIVRQIPSLGYLLSDEGSGAHIGKLFITAFLFGDLPQALHDAFLSTGNKTREKILNSIYKSKRPSAFLADMARFVGEHIAHPFCTQLVSDAFDSFIHTLLLRIPDFQSYKIGFTGAVAWNFREILIQRLHKQGANKLYFVEDPASALAEYYMGELS